MLLTTTTTHEPATDLGYLLFAGSVASVPIGDEEIPHHGHIRFYYTNIRASGPEVDPRLLGRARRIPTRGPSGRVFRLR